MAWAHQQLFVRPD